MLEVILLTVMALLTAHYVHFITRVRVGLLNLRPSPRSEDEPAVSVVVAARNEERRIARCLDALSRLDYPADRLEVVVVDDGSSDGTAASARAYERREPLVRVLSSDAHGTNKPQGKAAALTVGIAGARGEIILTTDADCVVAPSWARVMVSFFAPSVSMVAGPVLENAGGSFFGKMESLEFLGLVTTGAGLIGAGRPIICNGANLGYRRAAFEAVGGFGGANDDEALMNRIVHRNIGRIVFAADRGAVVETESDNSAWKFFWQRVRWAAKRGHYEDRSIVVTLVLLYLFFLSVLLSVAAIPTEPLLAIPVLVVYGGKLTTDWATLRAGAALFGSEVPALPFIVAELLHVPYIVVAAALGQFVPLQWKK